MRDGEPADETTATARMLESNPYFDNRDRRTGACQTDDPQQKNLVGSPTGVLLSISIVFRRVSRCQNPQSYDEFVSKKLKCGGCEVAYCMPRTWNRRIWNERNEMWVSRCRFTKKKAVAAARRMFLLYI